MIYKHATADGRNRFMESEASLKPVDPRELQELLSSCRAFEGLAAEAFDLLAKEAKRVFVPAGTHYLSYGGSGDVALVVEHGRCVARIPLRSDEIQVIEVGRGEIFALATTLSGDTFRGDLYALRDSTLIKLAHNSLIACLTTYPEMIKSYSAWVIDEVRRLIGQKASTKRPQAFALLPASDALDLRKAVTAIHQAFTETVGQCHLIDSRRVEEALACDLKNKDDFDRVRPKFTAWLEDQEAEGHCLLLVCDPNESNWTRWCLRQTDRIMIVALFGDTDQIGPIDQMLADRKVASEEIKSDLLLVHQPDAESPIGAAEWFKLRCLKRHHHVRLDSMPDFQRAARRLSERAVGLVLGGGGARGLAHIGVLQALEEANIPIDVIGGTSMGSVMAAAYARGWSPQQILEYAREIFADARAVRDIDFPMISILAGRKLNKALQSFFGDVDIADLWRPYFCISASLSEGQMMVHDRGPVWEKVRASCSLPGIFPPVCTDGHILVDGGVMNNVPMDVMGNHCTGGTVIAVNVGGSGATGMADSQTCSTTGWSLLRQRLNPMAEKDPFANIVDVLMWATTLSSKGYLQQLVAAGHVDLYLTPPVQEFPLLGFHAYQELFDIGYEYTREKLSDWGGLSSITGS
jgi:predicted acylesterase/phospholipase RssA/CRP-like cAMP-binding protein